MSEMFWPRGAPSGVYLCGDESAGAERQDAIGEDNVGILVSCDDIFMNLGRDVEV